MAEHCQERKVLKPLQPIAEVGAGPDGAVSLPTTGKEKRRRTLETPNTPPLTPKQENAITQARDKLILSLPDKASDLDSLLAEGKKNGYKLSRGQFEYCKALALSMNLVLAPPTKDTNTAAVQVIVENTPPGMRANRINLAQKQGMDENVIEVEEKTFERATGLKIDREPNGRKQRGSNE